MYVCMYVCESCECQATSGSQESIGSSGSGLQMVDFGSKSERIKELVMCRVEGMVIREVVYECIPEMLALERLIEAGESPRVQG